MELGRVACRPVFAHRVPLVAGRDSVGRRSPRPRPCGGVRDSSARRRSRDINAETAHPRRAVSVMSPAPTPRSRCDSRRPQGVFAREVVAGRALSPLGFLAGSAKQTCSTRRRAERRFGVRGSRLRVGAGSRASSSADRTRRRVSHHKRAPYPHRPWAPGPSYRRRWSKQTRRKIQNLWTNMVVAATVLSSSPRKISNMGDRHGRPDHAAVRLHRQRRHWPHGRNP